MRYFFISIVVHVLVLSFVWVGFSVPIARGQNSFTYLGELVSVSQEDSGPNAHQAQNGSDEIIFGENSAAFFSPWLKMRQVEKPN